MKGKESRTTHVHEDEGHITETDAPEESKENDHGRQRLGVPYLSPSRQHELLIDILDEEIKRGALDDPLLNVLAKDVEFNRTLDAVCKQLLSNQVPYYSWEDLKQDVMIKFGRWLWRYRYEASLKTILRRIAKNQLIDVLRQPGSQSLSLEDLLPAEDGIEFEVPSPAALTNIQDSLQVEEWLEVLTDDERVLFIWHHLEGRSLAGFARERGVTRQAIDRRWLRILNKLRPLVGADK